MVGSWGSWSRLSILEKVIDMALPVVLATAYKERENIFKTIVYVLAFMMLIYLLWKIFKAFEKIEKLDDAIKEGINEAIEGLKGITKPVTPKDTAEKITKEATKEPDKPYYVEKTIYDALKEQGYKLPENVKPTITVPKTETVEKYEQRPTIGSWTGIGGIGAYRRAIEEERAKEEQKITPMTEKERVEYLGEYYTKMAIKNLEDSMYYKIIWIDAKGLRHERIMKGADIKKLRVSKVISITPMPSTYRPTPIPIPTKREPI
ncbi:MAG: hypothetical protein H5T91_10475, partial [Synergistetes bacterium]|nr:hypothetical protein [Synergistota bacterium]